jgi:hypothetical protein
MEIKLNVLEQTNILLLKSVFTKDQCKDISSQILEYKNRNVAEDKEISYNANEGCWMGQPHFHKGFNRETEQLLIDKFRMACNEYYLSMPQPANISRGQFTKVDKSVWEVWAWANVNEPGSENREHVHAGYFMSGVAYFQVKGTGRLEFMPYNYVYKITHTEWPYYGVSYYEPDDGDIIMFPSFLLHRVERNQSDRQRITMAFNATLPMPGQLVK